MYLPDGVLYKTMHTHKHRERGEREVERERRGERGRKREKRKIEERESMPPSVDFVNWSSSLDLMTLRFHKENSYVLEAKITVQRYQWR